MPDNCNYLDQFLSPEEFYRAEILTNRSGGNVVSKRLMVETASWKAEDPRQLNNMTKAQLFELLLEQYGEKVYTMFPVGVYAVSFQKKYGITRDQVMKLAKAGIITVVGERKLRSGDYCKVFSAWDYFQLDPAVVGRFFSAEETDEADCHGLRPYDNSELGAHV